MIKLSTLLLEGMSSNEAEYIFNKFGVPNASQLSPEKLKSAWNNLAKKHHPDKGGKDLDMRYINAAYDVLNKQSSFSSTEPKFANNPYNYASDFQSRSRTHRQEETNFVSGKYYSGPINIGGRVSSSWKELNKEEALKHLADGGQVFVPGVSMNAFNAFFREMGFEEVKVIDWTSSAGDWVFGIRNGAYWDIGFQENAYPRPGMFYSINSVGAPSFEELQNYN